MLLKEFQQFRSDDGQVNMTPIIDIVFLLIIFFMLVCQFIVAENFEIAVPDKCGFAQSQQDKNQKFATVSLIADKQSGQVTYAVGSEVISAEDGNNIADAISEAIEKQLNNLGLEKRIVCVRADQSVPYAFAQRALEGIAKSSATDVQLAVVRNERAGTN